MIDKAVSENALWTTAWDTMAIPDVKNEGSVAVTNVIPEEVQFKAQKRKNHIQDTANDNYTYKAGESAKKARKDKKLIPNAKSTKAATRAGLALDAEEMKRAERAGRFGDGHAVGGIQVTKAPQQSSDAVYTNLKQSAKRKRFQTNEADMNMNQTPVLFDGASAPAVKGTSTNIEKSYFRLTSGKN